jgi:hypothetical protein
VISDDPLELEMLNLVLRYIVKMPTHCV